MWFYLCIIKCKSWEYEYKIKSWGFMTFISNIHTHKSIKTILWPGVVLQADGRAAVPLQVLHRVQGHKVHPRWKDEGKIFFCI